MAKGKGKQRKRVRKRRWDESDIDSVSRERRRVLGRETGVGAPVDAQRKELDEYFAPGIEPNAVVVSPYGVLAFAEWRGEEVLCRVDDELTDGKTSVLAPGDHVLVEQRDEETQPTVTAVAPRSNRLGRPAIGRAREQVFAANVDLLVIVVAAAHPAPKPGFVDRCLIVAERGGVAPLICVNKMDLVDAEPATFSVYREVGLPVFQLSCSNGSGMDGLRARLAGKRSVLAGHSGVGKTSIINAIDPSIQAAIQDVSESTRKGRHTTTTAKLYHLCGGIDIIDTPGIKQLGLWQMEPAELDLYFTEIAAAAEDCKFRDCKHMNEPKCGVRDAVEAGRIAPGRYASYLRIREALLEDNKPEWA